MTPPPLNEKSKKKKSLFKFSIKNEQIGFSSSKQLFNRDYEDVFLNMSIYIKKTAGLINTIALSRAEKSGGGKHLVRTGGARCVKVSFTRVPSTFPLEERHRRRPAGIKLSTP